VYGRSQKGSYFRYGTEAGKWERVDFMPVEHRSMFHPCFRDRERKVPRRPADVIDEVHVDAVGVYGHAHAHFVLRPTYDIWVWREDPSVEAVMIGRFAALLFSMGLSVIAFRRILDA
jgi:hypothetical protein